MKISPKIKNVLALIASILICQGAGGVGAIFTTPAISGWYKFLEKPSFSPPNWLFGPVWITLFTMMGISAYLIWKKGTDKKEVKEALGVFALQLILNILWSVIFFGLKNPALAFGEILILWVMILITIIKFIKVMREAGLLLIPYLLWVSFASLLNLSIALLN